MKRVLESLRKSKNKHTPLGLFGSCVLTILICTGISVGYQRLETLLDAIIYLDRYVIQDIIYQYRYYITNKTYINYDAPNATEAEAQKTGNIVSGASTLDRNLNRYTPELRQFIIKIGTKEICSNNIVNQGQTSLSPSGDHIVISCDDGDIVFTFAPAFGLNGFGQSMLGVMVLAREYRWVFASSTEVEGFLGQGLSPVEADVKRAAIIDWLESSSGLIAIGAASYEGFLEQEETRADNRSEEVYSLLLNSLSDYRISKSLFKLNLGQYDKTLCVPDSRSNSSYQRPIMVMGIFTSNQKNDYLSKNQAQKAVRQLSYNPPPTDLNLGCYSNFPDFQVDINIDSKNNLIQQAF